MKVLYVPSKDELSLKIHRVRSRPNKQFGPFKLWWDEEGNIRALAITNYTKELEEFRKNLSVIQLKGIWKRAKITDQDIQDTRNALLRKLEEKW
ncbi:hypothetical protein HY230_11860 [Candidatus Acetothermia bacterium]|nr:hypothetical protein [Candidatus Acetothermia bacterium]